MLRSGRSFFSAIAAGLMGRCEMIWTTAGTNRVCSRCMELKDKVVGHTDEVGVTLPPLHPRCRCAIMYREVGEPKNYVRQHEALMRELDAGRRKYQELDDKIEHETDKKRRAVLYAEQSRVKQDLASTQANLRFIRVKAAENHVVLTSGLSQIYSVDDIQQIVSLVRNDPENIRVLWNLANAEMKVLDTTEEGISHYLPSKLGFKLNLADDRADNYRGTFHEIGHLLDQFMGFKSVAYKDGLFNATLRAEAEDYIRLTTAKLEFRRGTTEITSDMVYDVISRELRLIITDNRHEISDIWHGATTGKVNGGFGHYNPPDYWTKDGGINLPKEAFAHMFRASIQSPESLAVIKKYFPKSCNVFEDIIADFVKEALE